MYYHSLNIKMEELIKMLKYKLKLVKIFTNSIVCTSKIHVRKYDNMHFKSNFCVLMYNDITQNESHFANPFLFRILKNYIPHIIEKSNWHFFS